MKELERADLCLNENCWIALILSATVLVLLISLYCLSHGITIVFMHLFYFPIILLAYHYRWKGFIFSLLLILTYGGLVVFFESGNTEVLINAFFRILVFIGIAAVVAYLSDQLFQAHTSLERVADIQESTLMNANVFLVLLDDRGRVLLWNNGAERISGYSAAEVTGSGKVWKLFYPDTNYRAEVTRKISEIIAKDSYFENLETTIRTKTGAEKIISWNTRAIPSLSEHAKRAVAVGIDISERKAMEAELSVSETRFRTMADWTYEWEYWTDRERNIVYVSPACERITGYSTSEFTADKSLIDRIIHPEDRDIWNRHFPLHLESRQDTIPEEIEFRIIRKDGDMRWIGHTCLSIFSSDGTWAGRRISNRDITEKKEVLGRIETLLRIQEEQARIINRSPAVAFLWKAEENWPVEMVSENVNQFGYSRDDFISGKVLYSDIIHHEDLDRVGREVEYYSSTATDDFTQDYRIIGKNQSVYWITDYTHIRRNKEGKITHYEGIILDITTRKEAEDARKESDARFVELFDTVSSGVAIYEVRNDGLSGKDYIIKDFNKAALELEGKSREEVIGKSLFDLRPTIDEYGLIPLFRDVWKTGSPAYYPATVYVDEKYSNYYENRVFRLPGGEIVAIYNDVTEQKRAEERLRFTNTILSTQNESSIDGILVVDETGKIISYNRRFIEMWGIPPDVIATRSDEKALQSVLEKLTDPPEFLSTVDYLYHHRDETSRDEITLRDGRIFDRYTAPMIGSDNEYYGRIWNFRDITERIQAERAKEVILKELEQKNAELDRFTYSVSHDLKSPLITIQGFLGYLKKDIQTGQSGQIQDDLERIYSAVEKMERLISSLLELSRSGRIVDIPVRIPFTELVNEAAGLLDVSLKNRGVTLSVAENLPEISGDRERLFQVMTNLLENAVKFMGDQKEPRIDVGTRRGKEGVIFFVRDNGIGIRKEDQPKIFHLFERLNPEIPGTGIGLVTVKRIIEAHGGTIGVESEGAGKGATFWFTLPGNYNEDTTLERGRNGTG